MLVRRNEIQYKTLMTGQRSSHHKRFFVSKKRTLFALKLAKEFGLDEKFARKAPSDGLAGKTDEDNFGFTYAQLDKYILSGECESDELRAKIEKMHAASAHKRKMPERFGIDG